MSLGDVLVIMVISIIIGLIAMLAEKFFQGKRLTIVRFCKNVIIVMIGCFVGFVVEKYNLPKWIMYTVIIVVVIVLAAVSDIVWKDKDNDESD